LWRRVAGGTLAIGLVIALLAGGLLATGVLDSGEDGGSDEDRTQAATYFDGAITLELPDGWLAEEATDEFNTNLVLGTSQTVLDSIIRGDSSSESEALLSEGEATGYIGFFETLSANSAQEALEDSFFLPEGVSIEIIRLDNGQDAAQYAGRVPEDQYIHVAIIAYGNNAYAFILLGTHHDYADDYAADFNRIVQAFRADIDRAYAAGIVLPDEEADFDATPDYTPADGPYSESDFMLGTSGPTPTLGVFE
jgi:hypothetical protein